MTCRFRGWTLAIALKSCRPTRAARLRSSMTISQVSCVASYRTKVLFCLNRQDLYQLPAERRTLSLRPVPRNGTLANRQQCGRESLPAAKPAVRADAYLCLWQTRCLRGMVSSRVSGPHRVARPVVEHSETPSGKILAVTDTNGPKVHTQFLYHRAH